MIPRQPHKLVRRNRGCSSRILLVRDFEHILSGPTFYYIWLAALFKAFWCLVQAYTPAHTCDSYTNMQHQTYTPPRILNTKLDMLQCTLKSTNTNTKFFVVR